MADKTAVPKQVVVESGHMVDAPDRPNRRFPPEAEPRVAGAIATVLGQWDVGPGSLVITQGANGTDLLVAEEAIRRGADVLVLLALPPEEFEARSVARPRSRWSDRFRTVLRSSRVQVQTDALGPLPTGEDPFDRNNRWALEVATATGRESGAPVRALVVWDGVEAQGSVGTAGFVETARRRSFDIEVIDPRRAWRTPNVPYWERQPADGPKRLLTLDGGGIRGVVALGILARMEELLSEGDPSFVLANYFDYIAGTSTGAIIATSLALGHPVSTIDAQFRELGPKIFKKRFLPARWRSMYKDSELTSALKSFFGADTLLGGDALRTLLLIVTHRADTDSLWPLSNNTNARYNDRSRADGGNLNFPLWQLVRGSSAAPVFFLPELIELGSPERPRKGSFEDGGVTPFNNPSVLLFEMATSPRYRLGWKATADDLLLVSVGTGIAPMVVDDVQRKTNLVRQAKSVIKIIMNGSSVENDRLCRVLGRCLHGPPLDGEFDADDVAHAPPGGPLFSYIRYSIDISKNGLQAAGISDINAKVVARLDSVRAIDDLTRIGEKGAEQVKLRHFTEFGDLARRE